MDIRLEQLSFEIPDDWRDQSTYAFRAPDGGTLVVEPSNEGLDAAEIFASALQAHEGVWEPVIIYKNRLTFRRGNGTDAPGAEGEQRSMDGASRLRFALAGLSFGPRAVVLKFLMPSRRDFLSLVRQAVASAAFAQEPWTPPSPPRGQRTAHAGFVSLHVPVDWSAPDTFEFLDPESDSVTLNVTVTEPMAPPGTIDWPRVIAAPFRILREQDRTSAIVPARRGWEKEWALELRSQRTPWIVRKSAVEVTPTRVLTTVGQAPENLLSRLDAAWTRMERTLRAGA